MNGRTIMKTYPLMKNGALYAIELDNIYIGTMTIAKIITENLGVSKIKMRRLFDNNDENHLEFEFENGQFVVWEPMGDNRRYWIGPKDSRQSLPQIARIEQLFQQHRPSFIRKFFGDLITLNFKELLRSIFFLVTTILLSIGHGLMAQTEVPMVDATQLKKIIQQQSTPLTLVNYWATWCPPCVKEFPELVQMSQESKIRKAVRFLFVSMDVASQHAGVTKFLIDQKYADTGYHRKGEDDAFIKAMATDWQGVLPAIAIYDKQAKLIKLWQGEFELKSVQQELGALIDKL